MFAPSGSKRCAHYARKPLGERLAFSEMQRCVASLDGCIHPVLLWAAVGGVRVHPLGAAGRQVLRRGRSGVPAWPLLVRNHT